MIFCRGTNDTDRQTDTQIFTSLFRDKLSLQGARIVVLSSMGLEKITMKILWMSTNRIYMER
jgi:hypothetical protein